jgi:hypothetical protein
MAMTVLIVAVALVGTTELTCWRGHAVLLRVAAASGRKKKRANGCILIALCEDGLVR